MRLYIVATLIKWASHGNLFKSVILRPGGIESMYSADDEMKEKKRKEEGEKRRIFDTDDRNRVYKELKSIPILSTVKCKPL